MAARKWTTEQKARQAVLIRTWAPWEQSTGPASEAGKKISSKNAVNFAFREVMREMARTNREIVNYIRGYTPPPKRDRTTIDALLDDLERALDTSATKSGTKAATQPDNSRKEPVVEPMTVAGTS